MRILLAKGGLDGHPRGIKTLARFLRDDGFEVIYLGMYQPPEMIFSAAIQEDPDIIGVSILSGGHKKVFRKLMDMLRGAKCRSDVVVGGIIPARDRSELEKLDVAHIFSPNHSMQGDILPTLRKLCGRDKSKNGVLTLGKRISLIVGGEKNTDTDGQEKNTGLADITGFTGSGGVGKSSIVAALIKHVYLQKKVAALFIDPAFPSGGALLGDRVRLHRPENFKIVTSPDVFIRSIAAHKIWKGVTSETPVIIKSIAQGGFGTIFVESVGVGQYDLGLKNLVKTLVYVTTPDMGDEMQVLKNSAMEAADIIVLNKSDLGAADRTASLIKKHFPGKKIVKTTVSPGKYSGIPELWEKITFQNG
ncbi:MAG: cobalamin-dependent protein [bacterium]|nr:cobalamin-dependent protein [bacterium]